MLDCSDKHRPGFLTPYFFGVNVTFAIINPHDFSTTYYMGTREEHLIKREDYPGGYRDFEYACSMADKERKTYYQKNKAFQLVVSAKVTLAPEHYHTNFEVNGVVIGRAETTLGQAAFDTNYYKDDVLVGASHTVQKGGLYETTYADTEGRVVGTSRMLSEVAELTTTYEFPSINEQIKAKNYSAANQVTAPYNTGPHQEEIARNASDPEPFRMFSGHIERKPQPDERKRHRCSIL